MRGINGLPRPFERSFGCEALVGDSDAIMRICADVKRLAGTESHVLVSGETGTGKEVVARLIHHTSRRAHSAMVALNCAAFSDSLLESELFGYERGAFSDPELRPDFKSCPNEVAAGAA